MSQSEGMRKIRRWTRRWVYLLLAVLIGATAAYHYARGPRMRDGGPAIVVAALPPYAYGMVTLDANERTTAQWLKELSAQAKVPIVVLGDTAADDFSVQKHAVPVAGTFSLVDALSIVKGLWVGNGLNADFDFEFAADQVVGGTPGELRNRKRVEVHIYPIGDLLEDPSPVITSTTYIGRVSRLEECIVSFCGPASWERNGGESGSVIVMGDRLIICQTPGVHWQIAQLLDGLRKAR